MSTSAQMPEGPRNILGIRAGINVSRITTSEITFKSKVDFQGGVINQFRLSKKLPFYLEVGLMYSAKVTTYGDVGMTFGYVQVPLTVNFRWPIGKFTVEPQIGFYYGLGVLTGTSSARENSTMGWDNTTYNQSDFGMRFGLGTTYKRFFFGIGYDLGFLNIIKYNGAHVDAISMRNGAFTISLGFNLLSKKQVTRPQTVGLPVVVGRGRRSEVIV